MNLRHAYLLLFSMVLLIISPMKRVQAQTMPVVHAVLFYSPYCGHCHIVITETLPPLFEKYGEQLQIIGVDISQLQGQTLFLSALQIFGQESGGVPFLVVGDTYLVGSLDIPEKFPVLIEQYLALGGVDWPDVPGLQEVLIQSVEAPTAIETNVDEPTTTVLLQPTADEMMAATQSQPTALPATLEPASTSQSLPTPTATPGLLLTGDQDPILPDKFLRDLAGNALSVIVLFGMLVAIFWTWNQFRSRSVSSLQGYWIFGIPALCLIGFLVASYLAYVETSQVTAICGPVGDCNTVQQSEYARLFGILPIGVLGLAGYGVIMIAWWVTRYSNNWLANLAAISLFILTVSGTLFSIYLTFLEPFVIGATCVWCLTSAVAMTTLMLLSIEPAKLALLKKAFRGSLRRKYSRYGAFDD